MHAGRLRELITIRRQSNVPDGKGAFDRAWTTIAENVPAEVVSLSGRESVIAQVLQGVSHFRAIVRFRDDIRVSDQMKWQGRELNVHSAEDREGTRMWTEIYASTATPQGA